ncbi:class III lanthionine synthetase LanKC [Wenjunlia tyrosinilytica]|uniref:non-specific serine/threonine protein kinase n=1 Tax=Wenjunlia tyrosinilytica TaxID=1544741 RepID=A0A917ZSU6_9ACTN|nr:class III lanthionine synthetase LanKC [Wenjunlia tyrosinilytica]GGO93210.1 serine/threonine protein kinase [Wenjunlia tyrosinilytica]
MDRANHLAYCRAGVQFYDHPGRSRAGTPFPATGRPAPPGWRRIETSTWVYLSPENAQLPDQGWKIHVSAKADDAAEVIDTVWEYCLSRSLTFKFLPDTRAHQSTNSKYAPRGSSGKLMTLYPVDDAGLKGALDELGPVLSGYQGPYILSDLRWRQGPLYLRYGGFARRECLSGNGDRTPAVARPDGVLVPDERTPVFRVPDWAPVPGFVAEQIAAGRVAQDGPAFPYTVEKALHYSNGGGIYLATENGTGRRVVLREARPLAGLDGAGDDAVTRLHREAATLRRLAHLDGVPALLGTFTAWEHHFLVQEYIEGQTLQQFTATTNPLTMPGRDARQRQEYVDTVLDILDQLERILESVHATGTVFGDLSPSNVMIRPDGRIALIDFEIAFRPGTEDPDPSIATPGFVAAHATGFDRDRYALDCLRLALFLPLTTMLDLDPARAGQLVDRAAELFPLPAGFTDRVRRTLTPPGTTPRTDRATADLFAATANDSRSPSARKLEQALVTAIRASATPERTDRLFPGEPTALHDGGYTLAHGAAGVLYALTATGHETDPEHHEWLWQATLRAEQPRPGLYDGLNGAAHTLRLLGRADQALDVLNRAIDLTTDATPSGMHEGLAGIGLNLRHLAQALDMPALHTQALQTGERLAARLTGVTRAPAGRAGLMRGWSGPALFFLGLYEDTGESRYLDLARRAVHLDLDHCRRTGTTLTLSDGSRALPTLGAGSAGIAVVLATYLRHRPEEELADALNALHTTLDLDFTVHSGLLAGRAGLAAALAHNHAVDHNTSLSAALTRHIRDLAWHALPYEDGIATIGAQNMRLSMDLATGTAGVLHALRTVAGDLPVLPLLPRPFRNEREDRS